MLAIQVLTCHAISEAIYYQRNHPSDEEMEVILRENYGHNIRQSESRHAEMQELFNTLQKGDAQSQQKLDEILKGGSSDIKRASSVDTSLYGTEAGVQAKKQYEKQQAIAQQKKQAKKLAAKQAKEKEARKEQVVKVAAGTVVIGAVAAAAAFLLGGNRSR
jgi:hypothetical protein